MRRDEVDRLIAEQGMVKTGGQVGVAAILFTYRCSIACRHCCFGCAGQRPEVRMPVARCVDYLADLHELGRVIHIAGGEAMLYWDELKQVLTASAARGVQPHFIESNASFATSDAVVRERLRVMQDCGLVGILLSTDPYHQAFVPPESFIRARAIAWEVFGERNVWASNCPDEQVREHAAIARDETRLRDYVRAHPPTLVGSAHRFAEFLPTYPLAELPITRVWRFPHTGRDCAIEFDREKIWEVHIDPYDNMQTNCGILLGNAARPPSAGVPRSSSGLSVPLDTPKSELGRGTQDSPVSPGVPRSSSCLSVRPDTPKSELGRGTQDPPLSAGVPRSSSGLSVQGTRPSGNLGVAPSAVAEMVAAGPGNANFITRLVCEGGPFALADFARERHGFAVPERPCSKCDLCYTVRSFLRPFYPDLLGPAEVYGG